MLFNFKEFFESGWNDEDNDNGLVRDGGSFIPVKDSNSTTSDKVEKMFNNDASADPNKIRMYKEKRYQFKPPPVSHSNWTEKDWIRYIDKNGKWMDK